MPRHLGGWPIGRPCVGGCSSTLDGPGGSRRWQHAPGCPNGPQRSPTVGVVEIEEPIDEGFIEIPFKAVCAVNRRHFQGMLRLEWVNRAVVPEYDSLEALVVHLTAPETPTTCEGLGVAVRRALRGTFDTGFTARVKVDPIDHRHAGAVVRW